jgi:hypothetical protein
MRNLTISIVCFIIPGLLFIESEAQSPFIPENLSLASGSEYTEVNPVISVDGKTLFFNRINHPENRYGRKEFPGYMVPFSSGKRSMVAGRTNAR